MNVLAKCPADCHKVTGTVYGRGIHPDVSPICLSALIDRAVSEYGGIISISIFPALEKYVAPSKKDRKSNLIKVVSFFGKPQKSYSVAKVDNVDLSEKDMRILDNKGDYSNEGRVEVRVNGKWGTICNKGNNLLAAKRICKDLGYNDGMWANPDGTPGFCSRFKGKNHCGSENYPSYFAGINCNTLDENFTTCVKKYANPLECSHSEDAIITCSSKSFENLDSNPDGIVKLVKIQRKENSIIGRLELSMQGEFKPVCKNNFSAEAANVACKQMGFTGGEMITPDPMLYLTKEISDKTPFAASDVTCNGLENNLLECNLKIEKIECTHDLDVVLRCDGNNGDFSGNSQLKNKISKEAPPALGRLTAVKLKVDCRTTGQDKRFRGDPGSLYLVSCPSGCKDAKGHIFGLGLYTLDSHICQAAIHTGVITNSKGGTFAFIKTWGQSFYTGYERNGITSNEFRDIYPVSFFVSSSNSQWKRLFQIWKQNSVGIYLEKDIYNELKDSSSSFLKEKNTSKQNAIYYSFMESSIENYLSSASEGEIKPLFEWIQEDPSQTFNDKENGSILIHENNMKALARYQIIIKASMTDFKNNKSAFLFSYSGCNGFNVFLDENDNIIFGDACNKDNQINTGMQFPLNDKSILWAFYENGILKVALFTQKMLKPVAKKFNKLLEITFANSVGIGRRADLKEGFFYGNIDFVIINRDEINIKNIESVLNYANNKIKKPADDEVRETVDNRKCLSSCMLAPTPGKFGAPNPPKEADPCKHFFYIFLFINYLLLFILIFYLDNSDIYSLPDSLLKKRNNKNPLNNKSNNSSLNDNIKEPHGGYGKGRGQNPNERGNINKSKIIKFICSFLI